MTPVSTKRPNALLHGALDALILKTLTRGASHGYAVARYIEETTGDAFLIEDGSLYPALYRPRAQGLGRGRVGHVGARPPREIVSG
jgi:DNA-binding PadR family transcriptional regulator